MTPASPPPVPAIVRALNGHVYNWLQRKGYPVRDFEVLPNPGGAAPGVAWASPGGVTYGSADPDVRSLADRYGVRGRLSMEQMRGARVVLHEALHQMRYGRTPDFYTSYDSPAAYSEEAATEAAMRDLMPHFTRELFGHRMPDVEHLNGNTYDDRVTELRRLSAVATEGGWRRPEARRWRRTFSHATPEERERMRMAAKAVLEQRAKAR